MNIDAAALHELPARHPLFARFDTFSDLDEAAPVWRSLESGGASMTPFQRLDWISAWQTHIGAAEGVVPLIVIGYGNAGEPLMLLPLGISRRFGCRTVHFLGGTHANFNAAVWTRAAAAAVTASDIADLNAHLTALRPRIDLLTLLNQPRTWEGSPNPLISASHCDAPSDVWCGQIASKPTNDLSRRLKAKQRKMTNLGEVRYWQARTEAESSAVIEAFFAQKSARLRASGIPDVFAEGVVRDFLRYAARPVPQGAPAIELFAMSVGPTIAAIYGGSAAGDRFSFTLNSITQEAPCRYSPGLLLFANILPMLRARGIATVDLGVGDDHYKRAFCPDVEPLADLFAAGTARGAPVAAVLRLSRSAKRAVKRSPLLFGAFRAARRLKGTISESFRPRDSGDDLVPVLAPRRAEDDTAPATRRGPP
jgi:CelD/BcsL family acetyltransferase involved in cellulose biosynthesis